MSEEVVESIVVAPPVLVLTDVRSAASLKLGQLNDCREVIKKSIPFFNKYFYSEPPKLNAAGAIVKKKGGAAAAALIDEALMERQIADEVAKVEMQNLLADADVAQTDWTVFESGIDTRAAIIENAPLIDYEGVYDKAKISEEVDYLSAMQDLFAKLPPTDQMSADQYAMFADEIIKRSSNLFNQMATSAMQVIDMDRSNIRIYSKLLTYPQTRIYLSFSPRNCFDVLPGLEKRETFETLELYEDERRKLLAQTAEKLSGEIICRMTFAMPSFGPTYDIQFEPSPQFHSSSCNDLPDFVKELRKNMEEQCDIVVQSDILVPAFWAVCFEKSKVIEGHTAFVRTSKELIARYDQDAKENIMCHTPLITMAQYIPVPNHDVAAVVQKKKKGEIQDNVQNFMTSDQLKVTSPHPMVIDPNAVFAKDREVNKHNFDYYYNYDKKMKFDDKLVWDTGLIQVNEDLMDDDMYEFVNRLKMRGSFFKFEDTQISTLSMEPHWYHEDETQNNITKIALPVLSYKFRLLEDVFECGLINVSPQFIPYKDNIPHRLLMDGLCFSRLAGQGEAAVELLFPNRIFSHCMIHVNKCNGKFKIGFIYGNDLTKPLETMRLDLQTGTQEISSKAKVKPLITQNQRCYIKAGDQLVIHYFYRGKKKLQCFLLIKLVRNESIMDVAALEVPEEQGKLVIWLGDTNDAISIIKSRMNVIGNQKSD